MAVTIGSRLSSTSVGVNKGTSSANGQVQVAGNASLSKLNSSFGGNSQVNGSTGLHNPINSDTLSSLTENCANM